MVGISAIRISREVLEEYDIFRKHLVIRSTVDREMSTVEYGTIVSISGSKCAM